jgi:hypothetical protein
VTLGSAGSTLAVVLPRAANAVVVRASIPSAADGGPATVPLDLTVGGVTQPALGLTNAFTHHRDDEANVGGPSHFFDDARVLLDAEHPAGTVLRLTTTSATPVTVDLVEVESVEPPLPRPATSISVVEAGADPTGTTDSTEAIRTAIADARRARVPVWIPAGVFRVSDPADRFRPTFLVDDVSIAGAGMWHTTIVGSTSLFAGLARDDAGSTATSRNVHLADLAMSGAVTERNDAHPTNGVGGALVDSSVTRVWIEHFKTGAWMKGPTRNLRFDGVRVRNTLADGIAFGPGTTDSRVEQSDLRGTADDALTHLSTPKQAENTGNVFRRNTVRTTVRGNGIAVYGGDTLVTGNRFEDVAGGSGVHVGQRYGSRPVGDVRFTANTVVRSGEYSRIWGQGTAAVNVFAEEGPIAGDVVFEDLVVEDSPFGALQFQFGHRIDGVVLEDVDVRRTGTYALQLETRGTARLHGVTAVDVGAARDVWDERCASGFALTDLGGNTGWDADDRACGQRFRYPASTFPDAHDPDFAVTSHDPRAEYVPGTSVRVTGTGTPRAEVSLESTHPGQAPVLGRVQDDGTWQLDRFLGTGPYRFVVRQRTGRAAAEELPLELRALPLLVSPTSGASLPGRTVEFRGHGTPGRVVRLHVTNFASVDVDAVVRPDGSWSARRFLGTGRYRFDITQRSPTDEVEVAVRGLVLNP